MLLLIISFIAGILTILAPCVLPVLPVIIGSSISGKAKDKLRPYIVVSSLALSIIAFTLLLKISTLLINISASSLDYFSGCILIALGLVSLFPQLWEKLVVRLNFEAGSLQLLGKSEKVSGKYLGAILAGAALGPVFASCSPTYAFILASIIPSSFVAGLIYLATYTLGLVLALLVVSLAGRKVIKRFTWAVDTHSLFRRLLGLLFILIGLVVFTGFQIEAETWIANHLPFDETKIERVLLSKRPSGSIIHKLLKSNGANVLNVQPAPAPEFQGLTNWINSPPLTLSKLKGKVVLVDFWTYSCINCIRTLPYLEKWDQAYKDKGLSIVGVNTPEFAFEHNPDNVTSAVKSFGIKYPVALDNNYETWNAYNNSSWPADYLIDKTGNIRYVALGEGDYDKTETAIQYLLGINRPLKTPTSNVPFSSEQSPETYFGTNRAHGYVGSPGLNNGIISFKPASSLSTNQWTLSGQWQIGGESITSNDDNAMIRFNFNSKDVYVVADGSQAANQSVGVKLTNSDISSYGNDVQKNQVTISGSRLYHIVSLKNSGQDSITLRVPKDVSLYTFTFGS